MIVRSDNQYISVEVNENVPFDAWYSHVESGDGRHLFVVATQPESHARLVAAREGISATLKKEFKIPSNAQLDYVERHPSGTLHQVNLDHLGPGPGKFGEPEHAKVVAYPVPQEQIQARLGKANMPVPPLTTENTDLNQSGSFQLRDSERQQARHEAQRVRKPKL